MKSKHLLLSACMLPLIAGCATDLRTSILEARDTKTLQVGFVYNLPAATVKPTLSLRIAGCPADTAAATKLKSYNPSDLPVPIDEVQIAVSGDIMVEQVRGVPVVIDYRELGDFLKTTNLALERHPNGMIKSVGVTIEDETPAVLANGLAVAASVVLIGTNPAAGLTALAATNPLGTNAASPPSSHDVQPQEVKSFTFIACQKETIELLQKRDAATKKKAGDTADLERETAALSKLLRHTDPSLTPDEIKLVHGYRDRIIDLTAALAATTEALASLDSKLSVKLNVPEGVDALTAALSPQKLRLTLADQVLTAFVGKHYQVVTARAELSDADVIAKRNCLKDSKESCRTLAEIAAFLKPRTTATFSGKEVAGQSNGNSPIFDNAPAAQSTRSGRVHPSQGIIYVEPAAYTFSLKRSAPDDPINPEVTLKAVNASVPQLGTYLALPVHAGFGEKVTLNATFGTDGSLSTASYGRPTSAGKALSASAAGLAEKYLTTQDAIAERKLKLLKVQTELLTAQKARLTAENALDADPLADINAQIVTVTAQAILAEASVRLNAANAKRTSP